MHRDRFYTLAASCPDRTGIIARVTGFFAEHQGWILESSFHSDEGNGDIPARYFMRLEIKASSLPFLLAELRERFRVAFQPVAASWRKFIRGLFRHIRQAHRRARHTAASAPRAEALRLRTTALASLDALLASLEGVAP